MNLRPVLHAEVERLPEKYRLPVILSYLEGKTNEEVAELLALAGGTVKGRLSRARDLLAFAVDASRAGPVGGVLDDGPVAGHESSPRSYRLSWSSSTVRLAAEVRPSARRPQPALA